MTINKFSDQLKNKTKDILNIKNKKFDCVRLSITAAKYPVVKDWTRENKYVSKLIDDYELGQRDYEYITGMRKTQP